MEDDSGRARAKSVTGPNGAPVQGRPRQSFGGDGGYGGGYGGGGFRGGGGGGYGGDSGDDDMWKPRN